MLADRLRWTRTDTIRLSLCRFDWAEVRSWETEVFTEDVEWWWIDSIGYGQTRPVSVFVGSTEQSLIARDLEKYTEVFTEDVKCSQSYSIGHGPSFRVSTSVTYLNSDVLKA